MFRIGHLRKTEFLSHLRPHLRGIAVDGLPARHDDIGLYLGQRPRKGIGGGEGIRTGKCPVRKKVSAVGTAEHGIAYDIRSTQRPHGQDIYRTPFAHVLDGQCLFERIQVFGVEDGRQGGTVHRTVGLHGILAHVARVGNLLGEYNYFQLFSH